MSKLIITDILVTFSDLCSFIAQIDKTTEDCSYSNSNLFFATFKIYMSHSDLYFFAHYMYSLSYDTLSFFAFESSHRICCISHIWHPFANRKVINKWWFHTVIQIHLCRCVTSKDWQHHSRNWFLERVYITILSIMFQRYKVAKKINLFARFKIYLWPNRQNTVWNIAKSHCVTFW